METKRLLEATNYNRYTQANKKKTDYNSFVHFSPYIEDIIHAKSMNCSWWWLWFWVYVSPVESNDWLRYSLHNLWFFIQEIEIPFYQWSSSRDCMIFELRNKGNLLELDYLTIGNMYLELFNNNLLDYKWFLKIELNLYKKIKHIDPTEFFSLDFFGISKLLPTIWFEAVQDFILLYENCGWLDKYLYTTDELYIYWFKEWLYKSQEYLKRWFTTKKFSFNLKNIEEINKCFHLAMSTDKICKIIHSIILHKYSNILNSKWGLEWFLLERLLSLDNDQTKKVGQMILKTTGNGDIYTYPMPKWEYLIPPFDNNKRVIYRWEYDPLSRMVIKKEQVNIKIKNESVCLENVVLRKKHDRNRANS